MFYSNSSHIPAYTRSTEFGVKHTLWISFYVWASCFKEHLYRMWGCRIERFCHISIILCKNDSSRFGLNGSIPREEWVFRNLTMVSYCPEPVLTTCEGSVWGEENWHVTLLPSVLFNIWFHMYPITSKVMGYIWNFWL